ncbi:hypothetical protein [Solirubrobacter soli]|uniref:hypothetical protein n=1 Tax=Solirubrobacter soli TaxID=363832 RepID=UPI0003F50C8E|nr:hypothetical protein [Solirubrobacter soli]
MTRLAVLIAALLALTPAVAHAATYEVWSCAGPDGAPAPADGWAPARGGGQTQAVNECASGNGLHGYLDGRVAQPQDATARWVFEAPSDTTIASMRMWRGARVGPRTGQSITAYVMYFDDPSSPAGGLQVEFCNADLDVPCSELGTGSPLGDGTLIARPDLKGFKTLSLEVSCTGGNDPCPAVQTPETAAFRIFRAAISLNDTSLPQFVTPPSGSLTTPVPLTGAQSIAFSAADTGSGVQKAVLEVDGQPAVTKELGCAPPYTAIVPCKLQASGTLDIDTATLADGAHTVRVLINDATGVNVTASAPFIITTVNTPSSCAAVESPAFAVAFDRKRGTIGYGGKLTVRGSLGGVPAGTQVSVYSLVRRAGAAPRFLAKPLATDAAGRFSYRVPAGPSRTLRFAARVPGQLSYACSKPLNVAVRATLRFGADRRTIRSGSRVRFSGRLLHGYVPLNGKVVELQAFERGTWRTFRTVRTNAKGAFSYRYRFSFRAAGTTFPVRARVRADASYPFALGTSKRVRVRVR